MVQFVPLITPSYQVPVDGLTHEMIRATLYAETDGVLMLSYTETKRVCMWWHRAHRNKMRDATTFIVYWETPSEVGPDQEFTDMDEAIDFFMKVDLVVLT